MYLLLIRGLLVRYIRDLANVLLWSRKKNNLQSSQQRAASVTEDLFEENPDEEQVWTRSNCIRTIVWDYRGTREVISFHLNIIRLSLQYVTQHFLDCLLPFLASLFVYYVEFQAFATQNYFINGTTLIGRIICDWSEFTLPVK